MYKTIIWRKGILYSDSMLVGRAHQRINNLVTYSMNKVDVQFETKGFLKKKITIISSDQDRLGNITLSSWSQKVKIRLVNGNEYILKKKGLFGGKWTLTIEDNQIMDFQFSMNKGMVNYLFEDEVLILSGFFVIKSR